MRMKYLIILLILVLLSISAVSAESNFTDAQVNHHGNGEQIYVSPVGSDDGAGNSTSPYATIGKAVSSADESTIYLSNGTFNGNGNNNLKINSKQITIIGAGIDETIIDLGKKQFLIIDQDSSVSIYNLTIINGYHKNPIMGKSDNQGGVFESEGPITIDNCKFANNTADQGGVIRTSNAKAIVNISNSLFINNTGIKSSLYSGSGGVIYAMEAPTYIENCKFINNSAVGSGGVICGQTYQSVLNISNSFFNNNSASAGGSISSTSLIITDCYFEDGLAKSTTSGGGAIFLQSAAQKTTVNLRNNTFINCVAASGFGNEIFANQNYNYGYVEIQDVYINGTDFNITAKVTDDMGTPIHGSERSKYTFKFNNLIIGDAPLVNGVINAKFSKLLENGEYNILMDSDALVVNHAFAYVNITRNFTDYYVSPSGNDNNNGSKDKPFKTIYKAVTEGLKNSEYLNIYLSEGNFNGEGNTAFGISGIGIINLIGVKDKTVIDGLSKSVIDESGRSRGLNFGSLNVNFYNISINNLLCDYSNYAIRASGVVNFIDCSFENNDVTFLLSAPQANLKNVKIINNKLNLNPNVIVPRSILIVNTIDNVTFENNQIWGYIRLYSSVTNSKFINNKNNPYPDKYTSDIAIICGWKDKLISENNTFINNTQKAITVANSGVELISINDVFINNTHYLGGAIYCYNATIKNALFENNAAIDDGGAICHVGAIIKDGVIKVDANVSNPDGSIEHTTGSQVIYHYANSPLKLENCTFRNNRAHKQLNDIYGAPYNQPILDNGNNLTCLDVYSTTIYPKLTVVYSGSSDCIIDGYSVNFYIDGFLVGNSTFKNNKASLTTTLSNGIYNVSASFGADFNVTDGILIVNAHDAEDLDVYVSQDGSDKYGEGTIDNPFATIEKAYEYGIDENTAHLIIHIIGTINGEGNVNLDLEPSIDLTILGEDKNTSIIDVGDNKYLFKIKPEHDYVNVNIKNLTIINGNNYDASSIDGIIKSYAKKLFIEDSSFKNVNGYVVKPYKNDLRININNCLFEECVGVVYADVNSRLESLSISNTEFLKNNLSSLNINNNLMPSTSININNLTAQDNKNAVLNLGYVNSLVLTDSSFMDNDVGLVIDGLGLNTLNNVLFNNNGLDLIMGSYYKEYANVAMKNCIFNNSGAFNNHVSKAFLTIENSIFENMGKEIDFGINNYFDTSNKGYSNISGCLFINNNHGINIRGNSNIVNSSFYNSLIRNMEGNYTIDYNYWNTLNPDVSCNNWIVPVLVADNKLGYTQEVTLSYMIFDGENYVDYDTSKVPVFDENYTVSVSDGIIRPTSGILTKDEPLTFIYTCSDLGNKTVRVKLSNDIILELNVTFYMLETQLDLTLNSDTVHVGDNLSVNVILTDNRGDSINGDVDIFLNGVLADTIEVIGGKGQLNIVMDKTPTVYEVFAKYAGSDNYPTANCTTMFTLLKTEINVNVKNKNFHDNVTFDVGFNYPANGTVDVTVNKKTYSANVKGGKAQITIPPMDVGDYAAAVSYNGIVNKTVPFTVARDTKTTIKAKDVQKHYKDDIILEVSLIDAYDKALANEKITVSVGGKTYTANTNNNGVASFKLDLEPGNYMANINYWGNSKQDQANTTAKVTVLSDTASIINVDDLVMDYKDGSALNVTLTDAYGNVLANGKITLSVDGRTFIATTNDKGVASFKLDLEPGNYTAVVKYAGSDKQDAANTTVNIIVNKLSTIITADDMVMYYKDGTVFEVTLNNVCGEVLANQKVTISIAGKSYTETTDEDGIATFSLNLEVGNYTVIVKYGGNDIQYAANTTADITVLYNYTSVISINDIVVYNQKGSVLNVTLTDAYDNALANEKVTVSVDGKNYTATTNDKGVASFTLDVKLGDYLATVTYPGNAKQNPATKTETIKVLSETASIITADDLVMYYKDGSILNVTLTNVYREALANQKITLSINGKTYTATTNDKGVASFKLDLEVGNYTAVVKYGGDDKQDPANTTVNIKVLDKITTVISADDLVMYYKDGTTLDITLTDIEGNALANENVILTINGVNKTGTTNKKGIASFNIDLEPGNYAATISYSGNSKYNPSNADVNVAVNKIPTVIVADDLVMTYGDEDSLNITLTDIEGNALANEEIAVSINGKTYKAKTNNQGVTSIPITLKVGNYTASISYSGNKEFDSSKASANIKVLVNTRTIIVADDLVMYYKNGSRFVVKLTDAFDTPLVNESIIISLNGANYTRTTNDKGIASIAINLNSGNYSVNVYYNGSKAHDAISASANINVLPTVFGKDIVKMFRNGTQYYATFLDGQGNPLADNTVVKFNINGVMYERKTNKGVSKLNINLEQGTYIITAINPVNGEMASNNITVLPKLIGTNLVKYYKNASQYWVQVFGDDGNPVGEGKTVTFNINGVMYERKTNASGWVKLNINLAPGKYIITAMYGGCNIANNITVKSILTASNMAMSYKDGSQFKVTLLDGQGKTFAGQSVTFNINGVFYNRITNSNGVAALNINLMPGEYIITSSYNGCNIANTIKIKS